MTTIATSTPIKAALALVCLGIGQAQTPAGEIDGFVRRETNQRPIAGALVTLTRVFPERSGSGNAVVPTVSQATGAFFFPNLQPGSYRVCVTLAGSDLLNPCEWSSNPTLVNLEAGRLVPGVTIDMKTGVRVHVRIDDPEEGLSSNSKSRNGGEVLVGLWTERGFREIPNVFEDDAGRNHSIVVPFGKAAKVSFHGINVQIYDKDNKKADSTYSPLMYQGAENDPPQLIRVRVSKK
jgi:hypothetical protein